MKSSSISPQIKSVQSDYKYHTRFPAQEKEKTETGAIMKIN